MINKIRFFMVFVVLFLSITAFAGKVKRVDLYEFQRMHVPQIDLTYAVKEGVSEGYRTFRFDYTNEDGTVNVYAVQAELIEIE